MNTALAFDLARPWLAPYRADAARVLAGVANGASVAQALAAQLALSAPILLNAGPLRFVDAAEQPPGEAYEAFIARTARVPTRDNLHDLFNGLVWLRHPALKRRLNEAQAAEIAARGVGAQRGAVRDALTVFDENGALLHAPRTLADALRRRDWQALFVDMREAWRDAELTLFGHALLEKLVHPRKPITAHVLIVDEGAAPLEAFTPERLAGKPFVPLPVLGVPGWWPANAERDFYDDAEVFRSLTRAAGVDAAAAPSR